MEEVQGEMVFSSVAEPQTRVEKVANLKAHHAGVATLSF
jgi:hypothetical protein